MPNERLRAALLERGITPATIGSELGVDMKTVERWIAGQDEVPLRFHPWDTAPPPATIESGSVTVTMREVRDG